MKQLKLFGLIALLALFSSTLFAEELKIKITALGNPLGYSYVYINGVIKAGADSAGVAILPMNWINHGDTISASFVGFNGAETVFDSKIQQAKELTLNLTTDFTLDEIVVSADIGRIYRKYIKKWETPYWKRKFTMQFDMSKNIDSIDSKCSGEISLLHGYRYDKLKDSATFFYKCIKFEAKGDTTEIIGNIAYMHQFHTRNFYGLDGLIRNQVPGFRKLKYIYGYLGIVDNYRAFTISEGTGQYIMYFNKDSGIIKRVINITLKHDENKNIIARYKCEIELGRIGKQLTIIDYKDHSESYTNSDVMKMKLNNFTISKAKKEYYTKSYDWIELKR